jgi:hypothetical protein
MYVQLPDLATSHLGKRAHCSHNRGFVGVAWAPVVIWTFWNRQTQPGLEMRFLVVQHIAWSIYPTSPADCCEPINYDWLPQETVKFLTAIIHSSQIILPQLAHTPRIFHCLQSKVIHDKKLSLTARLGIRRATLLANLAIPIRCTDKEYLSDISASFKLLQPKYCS